MLRCCFSLDQLHTNVCAFTRSSRALLTNIYPASNCFVKKQAEIYHPNKNDIFGQVGANQGKKK